MFASAKLETLRNFVFVIEKKETLIDKKSLMNRKESLTDKKKSLIDKNSSLQSTKIDIFGCYGAPFKMTSSMTSNLRQTCNNKTNTS